MVVLASATVATAPRGAICARHRVGYPLHAVGQSRFKTGSNVALICGGIVAR